MTDGRGEFELIVEGQFPETRDLPANIRSLLENPAVRKIVYDYNNDPYDARHVDPVGQIEHVSQATRDEAKVAFDILSRQKVPFPEPAASEGIEGQSGLVTANISPRLGKTIDDPNIQEAFALAAPVGGGINTEAYKAFQQALAAKGMSTRESLIIYDLMQALRRAKEIQ